MDIVAENAAKKIKYIYTGKKKEQEGERDI